jgi:hypothetical protein
MSNENPGLLYMRDDDNNEIVLHIKRENITTERNFKITEQEMYSNDSKHHTTNYYDNGDDGLSFKCTAVFNNTQTQLMEQLDTWYTGKRTFNLVFGKHLNLQLPLVSKKWIITKLSSKQEMDTVTEWDITYRTYNPPKMITAIKNKLLNRTAKSYKFQHQCKKTYKDLTYKKMKKKKGNNCAKLLNQILNELGYKVKGTNKKKKKYIPDKCTKKTSSAVKKFKKEWNNYKLKPKISKKGKSYTDVIDDNTYKALCNYKELKNAKKKK